MAYTYVGDFPAILEKRLMIKKSFTILNLILITAAVFLGVKIFYGFVTAELNAEIVSANPLESRQSSGSPDPATGSGKTPQPRYAAYKPVVERDLFKTGAGKPRADAIKPSELEKLQKTQLKLNLWGTITGNTGKTYAVIEDASKREQQLYREGDKIQHALIKMILRRKVVLTVSGQDEILEMEEQLKQAGRISATRDNEEEGDESPEIAETGQEDVEIERGKIDDALQNINDLMRQIRVRPYFQDGKPSGILLSGIRKNSIFEDMGLQSGDVVRGVNGKEIESVDDALKFYQNLKSSSEVELQIERNGDPQTINYRIQ